MDELAEEQNNNFQAIDLDKTSDMSITISPTTGAEEEKKLRSSGEVNYQSYSHISLSLLL